MKKLIALLLAALMLTGALYGCGNAASENASADQSYYTVGICQLVQHEALDAATKGFKDALVAELGDKVKFEEQNASGDPANCTTIVNGFVANNVDLIMANATPALLAASAATADIPILGTSVTDYASALEIDNWTGTVGTNVSGTSDLAPLDQQAAMIVELFPDAKNVVAQLACESSDVIYIPTDNTAASNTEAIANVVLPAKIPVIAGEAGLCKGCGVATLSLDYYDLGVATGKMAAKILKGEANVAEMPIEYAPVVTKLYNAANCEALGIAVPEGYEPLG